MKQTYVYKLSLASLFIAVGVVCSPFAISIGASKCFPVQHMLNVLGAIFLGPWWNVGMAGITSTLRILLGSGSLLAFPGSMCGAFLSACIYRSYSRFYLTYFGEILGTSIVGGILAYPIAILFMGKQAIVFTYILPFFVSTAGGTLFAALLIPILLRTKALAPYVSLHTKRCR